MRSFCRGLVLRWKLKIRRTSCWMWRRNWGGCAGSGSRMWIVIGSGGSWRCWWVFGLRCISSTPLGLLFTLGDDYPRLAPWAGHKLYRRSATGGGGRDPSTALLVRTAPRMTDLTQLPAAPPTRLLLLCPAIRRCLAWFSSPVRLPTLLLRSCRLLSRTPNGGASWLP